MHLMDEYCVPVDIAVQLKNRGFNEPCFMIYNEDGILEECVNVNSNKLHALDYNHFDGLPECISAPLYQQVVNWLERRCSTLIETFRGDDGFLDLGVRVWEDHGSDENVHGDYGYMEKYNSYSTRDMRECLNEGIREALKLL